MYKTPLMKWVRDEGRAEGKVEALLKILQVRKLPISTAQREQILACQDLAQLDYWLERAVTATSVADVLN
jgi:hypothetical protein